MAWKTRKQRKISKVKSRLKIVCFILLLLCIVSFSGILHGDNSEDSNTQTESSSMYILKQSDIDENSNNHCFGISIDGHELKINI